MIPFRKIPDKEIAEMAASNQNPGLIVCVNFKFPKIDRIFSIWARICSHTLHHITRIKPTTFGVLRDYCFNDYMLQELLATKILSHSGSMGIESIDYYDAEEMSFDTLKLLFRLANVLTTSNFPAEYVTSAEGAITTPCYFGPVTVPQLLAERGHVYNGAFVADVTATVLGITGKLTIIEPSMAFMKAAIERRLVATDCDFTAEVGETSISVNHTRTFGRKSSNSFSAEELDNVLREVLPGEYKFGEGLAHLYTEIPKIAEDGPYPVSKAEYDRLKASEPLQSAFVPLNIYGDGNGSYKKFPDINSLDSDTLRNVLDKMVSNPIAQAVNEGLVSPSKIAETVAHLGYQTDMDASIFSADGSKGVIAGVLDDSTLPVDADGNRAFILSDGVVPRRPTANCNHIQIRTQNDRTFELPLSVKTEVKRVYDVLVKDLDTLTKTLANLESREAKETNETEQRILGKLRTQPYERVVFCLSALRDAHGLKCFDSLIAYANDALSGDNTGMLMDRMLGFFIDIFVNKIGPNYYPCTNQLNNAALARLDPVAIMESFHQQALICSK